MVGGENDVLSADFHDFILCLNKYRVDYVLIGGYALAIHGVVRATGDIDFLYRRTESNVRRLCMALEEFGAPPVVIHETALLTPDIVTQFGEPPYRIDLLNSIDGVAFEQAWKGATHTNIGDQDVRVIGPKELRANKSATGRKKDADDLRRLTSRSARKRR
jgi:hypothetical protein